MKQKLNKLEKYWVMYDVGNSAFALLVSTIIPIYFKNMAAGNGISASDSTAYLSYAISISTLIVAILGTRCSERLQMERTGKNLYLRCLC